MVRLGTVLGCAGRPDATAAGPRFGGPDELGTLAAATEQRAQALDARLVDGMIELAIGGDGQLGTAEAYVAELS